MRNYFVYLLSLIQILTGIRAYGSAPDDQIQKYIELWNQQKRVEDLKSEAFVDNVFKNQLDSKLNSQPNLKSISTSSSTSTKRKIQSDRHESEKSLWRKIIDDSMIDSKKPLPQIEYDYTSRTLSFHFNDGIKKMMILGYRPMVVKTGSFEILNFSSTEPKKILSVLEENIKKNKTAFIYKPIKNNNNIKSSTALLIQNVLINQLAVLNLKMAQAQWITQPTQAVDMNAVKKQQKMTMMIMAAGLAIGLGTVGYLNWSAETERVEKKKKKELPIYQETVEFIKANEAQNKIKYQSLICSEKGVSSLWVDTESPKGKLELSFNKKGETPPQSLSVMGAEKNNLGQTLCKCTYNKYSMKYEGCDEKSICMEYIRQNYWDGVLAVSKFSECCTKGYCNSWLTSDFTGDVPRPGSSDPSLQKTGAQ